MKYLGLDLGTKRLGLAISDQLGMIAIPYKVISYNEINELIPQINDIINQERIGKIILGLPKNMNNTMGSSALMAIEFKNLLIEKTNLEVIMIDERLSTVEANNYLIDGDYRRNKRKKIIDAIAASIILDSYLRRKSNEQR